MPPTTFLFRVDASPAIGTGHAMRCLALAQAIQERGGNAVMVSSMLTSALRERLEQEGCRLIELSFKPYGENDVRETAEHAKYLNAAWVVIDGYGFDAAYQDLLRAEGVRTLFIDDYGHAKRYSADLILNQNASAEETLYREKENGTQLLLGTRFVILRKDFQQWRTWKRETATQGKRILITLGGADPENVTRAVIQALAQVHIPIEANVVVGGSNPHLLDIEETTKKSAFPISIHTNVTDISQLMTQADIAICAGGTTSYELAFLQVPMLTVILADNQEAVAESMAKAGCAVNLGWYSRLRDEDIARTTEDLLRDVARRQSMSAAGRALVDGEGTDRILMHLLREKLRVRRAREEDSRLLWEWANDPETRKASFSCASIPWEDHVQWFGKKLQEERTLFLMGVDVQDQPIGTIRFEKKEGAYVLSVAVAPGSRGKGFSKDLVRRGLDVFFREHPADAVHAYVKKENTASTGLFRALGFTEGSPVDMQGQTALHFTTDRHTIDA